MYFDFKTEWIILYYSFLFAIVYALSIKVWYWYVGTEFLWHKPTYRNHCVCPLLIPLCLHLPTFHIADSWANSFGLFMSLYKCMTLSDVCRKTFNISHYFRTWDRKSTLGIHTLKLNLSNDTFMILKKKALGCCCCQEYQCFTSIHVYSVCRCLAS